MSAYAASRTYPLSTAQTEIWLAQQLRPDSPVYNIAQYTAIQGAVDPALFEAALQQVIGEADSLRLQFIESEEGLQQRIGSPAWSLTRLDFSTEANPQAAADAWMRADYEQPVDILRDQLFCYALLKVESDRVLWYHRYHHIVMDGFGCALIAQRVAHVYSAMRRGVTVDPCPFGSVSQLLESDSQYRTSAQWARDEAYWLKRCTDWPKPMTLASQPAPALHHRLRQTTTYLSSRPIWAHAADARRLAQLMTAALAAYLHRVTSARDVVLGLPVKARFGADRHIPCMMSNILPIRLTVQPDMDLSSLMQQTAQEIQHGLQCQRYPNEVLRRKLGLTPGQSLLGPIVNVMLFDYDLSFGEHPSINHKLVNGPVEDLMIVVYTLAGNDQLQIDFDANPACYTEDELTAHQRRFLKFLEALIADPMQLIGDINLLDAEERQRLLLEWNATECDYPAHLCIHQLFEAQVEHTPDAIALVYKDQTLSYAELNTQANCLAHQLIGLGVKPDACVAICVERSPALVVGLLAILKAGGAYVPLDPAYSSERLTHILADTAPAILLADAVGRATLGEAALALPRTVLDPAVLPELASTNPHVPGLTAHHLAYVIYTSGSTGTPKGVMVEHAQIVRLFEATQPWYGFNEHDTWCLFHSFAFDFSVWELWGALRYGGKLIIVSHHIARSPQAFHQLVCEQGVTVLNQTPSAFKAFIVSQAQSALPDQLRYVIFGGEALEPVILQAWYAARDEQCPQLVNMYGITETTIHATYRPLRQQDRYQVGSPIGVRIPDLKIYLLDTRSQPVPLGAVGELYIGGAGVARGYWGRPELTAERFVPDPFSEAPNARMYKTGDLARYRPDGNLVFVGRNDHQIKIRGFRIEPGEIETHLVAHPQVRDAVVLMLGEADDKRLVAYVVAEPDEQLASTLHTHVAAALPEYMVPAAFVRLDALPLTPNGKLDRRALPAPDNDALARQTYEAPQGEVETALAAIWAELLNVDRVGRHDSFFALGGHSLLAVRVMNRVAVLGAELPLATLLASPSLAAFAAAVNKRLTQGGRPLSTITPVSREGHLPLSFAQQRLWFLAQFDGVSDAYHISLVLHLHGNLDKATWQQALNVLLARHEALRSTFITVDGQPQVQLLPPDASLPLRWHDLRDAADADAQLAHLSTEATHAPFDLAQGPLIRACLIQLADNEHVLVLTQHHIVSDGWSLGILLKELSTLYTAGCAGKANPLSPLAIQYPDYAAWQRQWLSGERLETQSNYWRTTLADAPVLLNLPTDRPRPTQQSFTGAQVPVHIDAQTTRALKRLSHEHGTTLFMTVLAAWSVVLSRLSGQDDLIIGTPSANRGHKAIEPLIGFFVNTLALRLDLSGEPDVAQLLERVRRSTLEAQAHQDLPFEQVVEIVQPPRRLSHTPLFQVMFAWQNNETEVWNLPSLKVVPVPLSYDIAKFDLELHLYEADGKIVGNLGYVSALFDRSTIERHIGYLHAMLRAMVANARQPIGAIDLLSPAERKLVLQTWNATQQDYPSRLCVHELFEAQVMRTPDAPALVREDQTLSYAELNAQANRLAYQLVTLDIKPGDYVATLIERSVELVVAQLAILKAGATYVPIDCRAPVERQAWMISDCAARLLLTGLDTQVPPALSTPLLRVAPTTADPTADMPVANLGLAGSSLDSAYVMYTSGSTGTPKGVMVPHRGIARLVINNGYVDIGHDDRVAFAANPAFDASTFEVWAPLLNGGTLVVIGHDTVLTPAAFAQALQQQHISILWLTVGFFNQLAVELGPVFPQLKTLIVGGDALDSRVIAQVLHHTPPQQLINGYGPTESTTFAATYRITAALEENVSIPIGRPIANTRIYLLDAHAQPVPLGAVGELYIGGAGVARGYLNRPALSAERFVPDPFSDTPDARMYKTGDLARYRPDGNLEYLGRNDQQIKIRGFRIELGEIEARLMAHPQVRDAAVRAVGEGNDKRLAAYIVAAPDTQLASTLRAHAAAALPEYMVPATFVWLDALPLTPNGKLDHRALPVPDLASDHYRAPRSPQEQTLAELFAEVLGLSRVGIDDSFFDLGGHSLLAMRLVSRIRTTLSVELAIRTLFETPTVAGLVQRLAQGTAVRTPLHPQPRPEKLPLSFAQRRLWFIHQLEGSSAAYNIPLSLRLSGTLDTEALQAAIQDLLARHESLRTLFAENDGVAAQQILPIEDICFTLQIVEATTDTLARALAQAAAYDFDLACEIPLRAWLFRLDAQEHVLLLLLHHIVGDGWSMAPLARDLSHAYRVRLQGQPPAWAPLPVQYADYTLWQQDLLGSESDPNSLIACQFTYWKQALADLPEQIALPTDRPRPPVPSYRGNRLTFLIDAALHGKLQELARERQASLFMVLHAALAALLTRLGAGTDIPLGSPIAGRTDEALNDLVGFFVNTLVLRADTSGNPSFDELLQQVHATCLAAYAHQDVPFERLVEMINPTRSITHHPLFQVLLVLQNAAMQPIDLPGLRLTPVPVDIGTAKFDLLFSFNEVPSVGGSTGGLEGLIEYATDLFDQSTIERLAAYLVRLLAAIARDPAQPINQIELLNATERQQLLVEWNDTAQPVPKDTLPALFKAQAAKTPDAIALVFEDQQVSYAELDTRANRLAHYLSTLGIGPDVVVGILVDRCPDMVVGLLGILKAGGAYLPLDPDYPPERLRFMVENANVSVMLTQAHLETSLLALVKHVIRLDADRPTMEQQPTTTPENMLHADHLAYVIYTSGSIGKPKAVAMPHRALVNLINWHSNTYLTATHRILQLTPISFDVSFQEIFTALATGRTLVLVSNEIRRDHARLLDYLLAQDVHEIFAPQVVLESLIEEANARNITRLPLKHFYQAGEALRLSSAVNRFFALHPEARLYNHYGPSETHVVTAFTLPQTLNNQSVNVSIGRPIDNVRVFVLDSMYAPVPIGVAGELYIAGASLARGYFNQPDLTAERFIPNPFEKDGRLYKTGDLARWRVDGQLEYLGRTDQQVKLRGFRIEVGEIEAALANYPGIAQVAVLVCEDHLGEKRLVAYLTATAHTIAPAEIKFYLSQILPDYMIPATFVMLESLPFMPSGKLDRRALPVPNFVSERYRAPRSPREQALAELFAEVLGLPRVGIDDSFFDLGGHSLLATRLISRIRATLGVEITIRAALEEPTVAGLAQRLREFGRTKLNPFDVLLPIRSKGTRSPLFCIHPASGMSWNYIGLASHLDADQPLYGLQARGFDGITPPATTVEAMASDYIEQIRLIQQCGPYHLLGWSFGGCVAQAMAAQLEQQGEEVALLALLDSAPPRNVDLAREQDFDQAALLTVLNSASSMNADLTHEQSVYQDRYYAQLISRYGDEITSIMDKSQWENTINVMRNNIRILNGFSPPTYRGDMLFFRATLVGGESGSLTSPYAWKPYALGNIEVYDISCEHENMDMPEPAAKIGGILTRKLKRPEFIGDR